jgi:PAS domain S-box-containing protein
LELRSDSVEPRTDEHTPVEQESLAGGLLLDDILVRSLLAQVPDGLLVVDEDGRIRYANDAFGQMFGYDPDELLGETVECLVPSELRPRHTAHRLRYRAAPHRRPMGRGLELMGQRKDGSTVPVEISLSPLQDADDLLTIATVRDVSERRATERQIRWVERLLDTSSDAIYVFSPSTLQFAHVNEGACRQSGYSRDSLLEMGPLHLLPDLPERRLRAVLGPLTTGDTDRVDFETSVRRADGADVPVEVVCELAAPEEGHGSVFVALARDVSERLATQRVLEQTRQRLVVSEDRERIARDLHDKVIQRLFATGLSLQAAADQAAVEPVRKRLQAAVEDLDQAIREIRTSIFALHAPATDDTGLRVQVIERTTEVGRLLGFTPSVQFRGPVDTVVTDELVDALLATLQEALSNIVRHAQATDVHVEVSVEHDLELVVRDNGVGFLPTTDGAGRGLRNMQRRALELHGTLDVGRGEPRGTELIWRVPLP